VRQVVDTELRAFEPGRFPEMADHRYRMRVRLVDDRRNLGRAQARVHLEVVGPRWKGVADVLAQPLLGQRWIVDQFGRFRRPRPARAPGVQIVAKAQSFDRRRCRAADGRDAEVEQRQQHTLGDGSIEPGSAVRERRTSASIEDRHAGDRDRKRLRRRGGHGNCRRRTHGGQSFSLTVTGDSDSLSALSPLSSPVSRSSYG
jgi:hypothetical protein